VPELRVGDVTITRVIEIEQPLLDPLILFPDCTPEILDDASSWLGPRHFSARDGLLVLTVQSFLVRSHGQRILVDTCVGNCKRRGTPAFDQLRTGWLERFSQVCDPADVDIVVCTHLHVDHVGWNTIWRDGRWTPTFPNARYLFTQPDYDFHTDAEAAAATYARSGDYLSDSIRPVIEAGLCDVIPVDHRVDDAVSLFPTPGHTAGHACVAVASAGAQAAITGDLFHSPLQCRYPHWSTLACFDPVAARRSRTEFFEAVADSDTIVFPAHFPSPTAGRIVRAGEAFDFRYLGEG
jgi:glyoxylase-like metal-dependent hydrolase (beta-lactamase superfamily II)